MRTSTLILLGALGATTALYMYSRTPKGGALVASASSGIAALGFAVGDFVGISNRGLRDNNPGNIRRTSDQWIGALNQDTVEGNGGTWDAAFVQFDTLAHGVRAFGHVLTTYVNAYGLVTVRGIVSRYAPPEDDNDTESYIASVCADLGVGDNQPFDVIARLPDLATSMMQQETGFSADRDTIATWVYS